MGKRHNTLDYKYFHKTKYIRTLEEQFNIDSLKKDYKEQFDIMYDIFKTLILLNNIIFADSNKNIDDKITDLQIELEKCLYGDLDNDSNKYKYSVRQIKALLDSYSRHLYNSFIEWYDYLENINNLAPIKHDIEQEMQKLEQVNFDFIVEDDITFKKDKDSKKSYYLSRFFKYKCNTDYLNKYLDDYYEQYNETLPREDLTDEICFIFNLVASANNGILNLIYKDNLSDSADDKETFTKDIFIKKYFNTLNIEIDNNDTDLTKFVLDVSLVKGYFLFNDIQGFKTNNIDDKDLYSNYDYYYFISNIDQLNKKEIELETSNPLLNKIVDDLKNSFELLKEDDIKKAYEIIDKIITRNKDIFIRIS